MSKRKLLQLAEQHEVQGFYKGLFQRAEVENVDSKLHKKAEKEVQRVLKGGEVLAVIECDSGHSADHYLKRVIAVAPSNMGEGMQFVLWGYNVPSDGLFGGRYNLTFGELSVALANMYNRSFIDVKERTKGLNQCI